MPAPAEAQPEAGFHALDKLLQVDKEEALLVLGIVSNPGGRARGVEELKARCGRVVVTKAEAGALLPARKRPPRQGEKVENVPEVETG